MYMSLIETLFMFFQYKYDIFNDEQEKESSIT